MVNPAAFQWAQAGTAAGPGGGVAICLRTGAEVGRPLDGPVGSSHAPSTFPSAAQPLDSVSSASTYHHTYPSPQIGPPRMSAFSPGASLPTTPPEISGLPRSRLESGGSWLR